MFIPMAHATTNSIRGYGAQAQELSGESTTRGTQMLARADKLTLAPGQNYWLL